MEQAFNDLITLLIQKTEEGADYVNDQEGRNTIKGYWDNIYNYLDGVGELHLDDLEIRQVVESIKDQYGNNNNNNLSLIHISEPTRPY